jgi:hypothetical protein
MRAKRPIVYANPQERKKARLLSKIARVQQQLSQLQHNLAELLAHESKPAPAGPPHPN